MPLCNIILLPFQSKLDDYQERMNKGERLNQDQLVKEKKNTNQISFKVFSDGGGEGKDELISLFFPC